MKGIYILGISSMLILSACNEKGNTSLIEDNLRNQNNNIEGITFGYEYNWDDIERDLFSLDSQLNKVDYNNIKLFFDTFTLPTEGLLKYEDVKNYFPKDINMTFSNDKMYYKNYLVFDNNTKMAMSTNVWGYDPNTVDPIKPFDTQAIGLFMSIVEEINNKGYLSPNGEVVSKYTELTKEEKSKRQITPTYFSVGVWCILYLT